jgi:two-component system, LuxR family, response regulator FixJ
MSCAPGWLAVVDDDAAVCDSLKFALELEGFVVHTYRSSAELLAEPDLARFGCFIIDQYMPGLTGVELVRRVRERGIDTPAILITARRDGHLRLRAANGDVYRVLEKPLEGSGLLDAIRAIERQCDSASE